MQELENARKEQEKLMGKQEETKMNKKMFRAEQLDSEYDSGCESSRFFVARGALHMVFLKQKSR